MKSKNVIHIKFDYANALYVKKDFLASEIDLLKISQRIKKYREYRLKELEIKQRIYQKLRAANIDLRLLQKNMPEIKIPKLLKPEERIKRKPIIKQEHKEIQEHKDDLESQLQEIERKLNSIK